MVKNYYFLINFFLSIFGIFLSFFYFGYNSYFYPKFELINIFINAFAIGTLSTFLMAISFFILSKQKLIEKIFICSLNSAVIFIIYHYLFKFADISYFEFFSNILSDNNNIFIKTIFYFYPFIFSLIIFFFLSKKKIKNLNKFLLIFLIILNLLSVIRIFTIYGNMERSPTNLNDYVNFKSFDEKTKDYKKKVFLLIFDEFDQYYFEKNLDNFDYLKEIYSQSYAHKNFYAPAKFTMDSIPAILTGKSIKKTFIKNGNFSFLDLNNKKIDFNYKNSLFNQNNDKKISTSIYGNYHPYCRIFKVKNCYDVYNFKKTKINFFDSIKILSDLLYLNKILKIDLFKVDVTNDTKLSKFIFLNNNNFLLSNSDIVYIHYPYPHLPLKTKNIIQLDSRLKNLSDFKKNFLLVENTLINSKDILGKFKGSLLIITSDHWFRELNQNKALPSVFISKIIDDNNYFQNISDNNASSIKGLIDLYFKDKIKSNFDIMTYFNNQTNHATYVRKN